MARHGRYELVRLLGRGGMGEVWSAERTGPGGARTPVALKTLHDGSDDALRREARLGALLRHRHLVDVYEVGEHAGRWFCAMELCDGSLADWAPLPPRAVVDVGLQVCAALGYAHAELGLVHQDLKPANLLVSGGEVKVADLGLAHATGFARRGKASGTPGYMAPEQRTGGPIDGRTDIYALGKTLLELATGSRDDLTSDDGWLDDDATVAPAAPSWLRAIVDRCLEPDPRDRWPDIAALASALRQVPADGASLREVLGPCAPRAPSPDADPGGIVGRVDELRAVVEALEDGAPITLVGPGGVGKTCLAAAAVARWRGDRPLWSCDLSGHQGLDDLMGAVATCLGVPLGRGEPAQQVEQLGRALAARGPAVLVLDGFEGLVVHREVVASWRARAPEAHIVVTSRQRLQLPGEQVVEVGPLASPDAIALLVARAARRAVDLTGDPGLDELAARLDGLPLAIELAAGRLGVLSVQDVLDRVGLSLLRDGGDGAHGALRTTLDLSWELLGPDERRTLAQLSVFRSGFALVAAEGVVASGASAGAGRPVLDTLDALRERSLLTVGDDGRLALLGMVREYAAERLAELGDEGAVERHGRFYASLGRPEVMRLVDVSGGTERLRASSREVDNLAAACDRAVARGDTATAVGCLRGYWQMTEYRGPFQKGLDLSGRVGAMPGLDPMQRGAVAAVSGRARHLSGHVVEARQSFEEALTHLRGVDPLLEATVLGLLGVLDTECGRLVDARERLDDAARWFRAHGHAALEGATLVNLATVMGDLGRWDEARDGYEAGLALHRAVGNRRSEGVALGNLGNVHWAQGRADEALAAFEAALAIHLEVGNRRSASIARCNIGSVHAEAGRLDDARRHFLAALDLQRQLGLRRPEGITLANLAELDAAEGRHADAHERFAAALIVAREVHNVRSEGILLVNLGELLTSEGRRDEARDALVRSIDCLRSIGDAAHEATAWCSLALLAIDDADLEAARAHLAEAVAIAPAGVTAPAQEITRVRAVIALRSDAP